MAFPRISSHGMCFSTCYCAVLLCIACVHCAAPRPKCRGLLLTASVRRSRYQERESQEELKKLEQRSDRFLFSVLVEIRLLNFLFYPIENTLPHLPDIDFDIYSGVSLTSILAYIDTLADNNDDILFAIYSVTCSLTCHLVNSLTYHLTYLLTYILANHLPSYLLYILTCCLPSSCLTYHLAYSLTYAMIQI